MEISKRKLIIPIIVLIVIFIIPTLIWLFNQSKSSQDQGIESVSVKSKLTGLTEQIVPYYKADYTPGGADLVDTTYQIFSLNSLDVPDAVKSALSYGAVDYLHKYLSPNAETVYIYLDKSSLEYHSNNNFSFDFYTDSPERYFTYIVTPIDYSHQTVIIKPINEGQR